MATGDAYLKKTATSLEGVVALERSKVLEIIRQVAERTPNFDLVTSGNEQYWRARATGKLNSSSVLIGVLANDGTAGPESEVTVILDQGPEPSTWQLMRGSVPGFDAYQRFLIDLKAKLHAKGGRSTLRIASKVR